MMELRALLNPWSWLIISIICSIVVQTSKLYPFGPQNGDSALARADDAFTTVNITFQFHFFGLPFNQIHLSTNGIIYFGQGSDSFTPVPYPVNGTLSVAAYWVDSDPTRGGNIFYREEFKPEILNNITAYIKSKFVQYKSYRSSWALIVTFNDVARYNCHIINAKYPCNNVVNHQTILTSDGIHSFVIFLYDKLQYAEAQIGFNAGDGIRYFLVSNSNTDKIGEYALQNSNVGVPGEWMFSIGDEIEAACNSQGLLQVYPKKVLYFGPQELYISGPCLGKTTTTIKVKVGKIQKPCSVLESKIKCLTSYSDDTARVPIAFTSNNTEYKSFIVPYDIEDPLVRKSTFFNIFQVEEKFVDLLWNQTEFKSNFVELRGTKQDIHYDTTGKMVKNEETFISVNISNNGNFRFDFTDQTQRNKATRILLNINNYVFEIFRHNNDFSCKDWYNNEPKTENIIKIKSEESKRNPCQPIVPNNFPDLLPGGFRKDTYCNPSNPEMCKKFHIDAKGCYRSTNNPNRRAVQCCYNFQNQLIVGPPGGGSLDMADSDISKLEHFWSDIRPYIFCCKMTDECDKYYVKRPTIDSRDYIPPRPARANGDPHFVTMDGTSYEFNPVGEFIYLQAPDTMVQARMKQITIGNQPKPASFFSAFAIQVLDNVFQIELASNNRLQLRIDNQLWTDDMLDLDSVVVDLRNKSDFNVETTTGLSLHLFGVNDMLHIVASLQPRLKGKVFGLLGNWDDNPSNDLMFPNKTWIPTDSSPQIIYTTFGKSWSTTNETSIFWYPEKTSWMTFQNPEFVPLFSEPTAHDPQCGDNKECIFDLMATGNINMALSNVAIKETFEKVVEANTLMNKTCDTVLTIPNGKITVSILNNHDATNVNYTINCNKNFTLKGNAFARCVNGNLLEEYGMCSNSDLLVFQLKILLFAMLINFLINL